MTSHLLAARLNQQRSRIAGMMMPNAKMGSSPKTRPHTSLLSAFGRQKFLSASRKMRSLDPAKLGSFQPLKILQPLITSLKDAAGLLHLKFPTEEASETWNPVETVFPQQTIETEPIPEEGVLRAGSVIPRMPSFPKPGQSLESFKKQVENRPETPLVQAVEAPTPRLSPDARRFSRIQEFPTTIAAKDPQTDNPEAEMVTRQVETTRHQTELPRKAAIVEGIHEAKSEHEPELYVPAVEKKAPPVPGSSRQEVKTSQEHPTEKPDGIPSRVKPKAAKRIEPPMKSPGFLPKVDVQPAREEPKPEPLPVKRLTHQKTTVSNAEQERLPISKAPEISKTESSQPIPLVPPVRKLGTKKTTPLEEDTQPSEPTATTQEEKTAPETKLEISSSMEGSSPEPPSLPEATPPEVARSRKMVAYRRQIPGKVKSIHRQATIPPLAVQVEPHKEIKIIPPNKYRLTTPAEVNRPIERTPEKEMSQSELVAESEETPVLTLHAQEVTAPLETPINERPLAPNLTASIPMALAYPPRQQTQLGQENRDISQNLPEAPLTVPPLKPPHSSPTPQPAVSNVVQRKWPEHEGSKSGASSGSTGGEETATPASGASSQDLAKLAEDVFPYVKRLIEIESDRLSSRFR